ncbi:MAG TPA: AP2 domain-containing protein, partial [Tepidisphaeraceae bacterium]|nr:AP2 domain-containing protein [Tepidisphaeraceae bacterium]
RAVVPDGFVDGDQAARMLGVAPGTWRGWRSGGTIEIESIAMAGPGSLGRRKLYAVGDVERVREKLRAAGKLFIGPDELGPGKWLTIDEAAATAGVWPKTWDIWSKSGRVPPGVWVKGPGGQPTQMWPEKVALDAQAPETGDGTWATTEESLAILRTSKQTLAEWVREGRVPAGVPGRSNGSPATLWQTAELRALRAEWDARPFPPAGYVDRAGAEAALGISPNTLSVWVRHGRLDYAGELMAGPNEVECRVYRLDLLLASRERMRAVEERKATPPEGYVDVDGAAAVLGVHKVEVNTWQREGRIARGRWMAVPGVGRWHVFALADLERAKRQREAEREAERQRPTAPEGFVELHEAARRLGVREPVIRKWELAGRIGEGRWTPIPGTSARTKVYPIEDVERLGREIEAAKANFPPAGWVALAEAARRAKVSVMVWKNWIGDGRVESGRWVTRPTGGKCKLYAVEEVDRLVAEAGRDHDFFVESDGAGGWRLPAGYVGRAGAAAMFGVAEGTFVHWQGGGRITCGRWARAPVGAPVGVSGRRAYPVDEIARLVAEFEKAGKPYVDPADPAVARVPIMSWSETRFEALVDAADLPLIEGMRWNWSDRTDGEDATIVRSAPSGEQVQLRRVLLGLVEAGHRWKVAHRNGDALDCRRANLVVRDPTEHLGHARKRRTAAGRPCTSRFKGVCWIEKRGTWRAQIRSYGQTRRLGNFDDELAAAEAYDEAARELFGEHARLNFPDGIDARLAAEAQSSMDESGRIGTGPDAARPGRAQAA